MKEKIMQLELSAENLLSDGYYYTFLDLPAEEYEIRDALQKIRSVGRNTYIGINIYDCEILPELIERRPDSTNINELNFLAKRLAGMPEEQRHIFCGVAQKIVYNPVDDLVSIKDLINSTYNLDSVMIASNVGTDEQLGAFIIENDLNEDISAIPEQSRYLLKKRDIGRRQRKSDGGVFIDGHYVVAGDYVLPEIYDGKTLPNEEPPTEWFAFRLQIAGDEWINLPTTAEKAAETAHRHQAAAIEDCECTGFESSIPQITESNFRDMEDFDHFNRLAEMMLHMTPSDQVKFKAVLEAGLHLCHMNVLGLLDVAEHLDEYELSSVPNDEEQFFREYLRAHMDTKFDARWLSSVIAQSDSQRLLDRLGATATNYGVISARGRSLFETVSYDEPQEKELAAQNITDEKLEVVEVLGQTALFTNGRVTEKGLPDGLYKYDLREGESVAFATIEPNVMVNHSGTVLLKAPLDFGDAGCFVFDNDSSPHFLGYYLTPQEFMEIDFTQRDDCGESMEETELRGIQL